MMFWYDHDLSAWGWIGMILTMLAFWGLVVAAVAWLLRSTETRDPRAEELLAERFARGEIDEVEYRERLATLHGARRQTVR